MRESSRCMAVRTGDPPVTLLACTVCGVLLWNIDAHYQHSHPLNSKGEER